MYSAYDLQRSVLDCARARCTNQRSWMTEIGRILSKSKHSIYKKYQGEIGLSLREVLLLSQHFDMRIDPMLLPDRVLSFDFHYPSDRSFDALHQIRSQLEKVLDLPDPHLRHACIELPLIHDYNFPVITSFKFFIHEQMMGSGQGSTKYRPQQYLNNGQFSRAVDNMLQSYYQIPSKEYWNDLILDITLSQIHFTLESGLFADPEDAYRLCEALMKYLDHLEMMTDHGRKFTSTRREGSTFELYFNEIAHANNIILVESARIQLLYLSFGNPHFMFTSDTRAVAYYKSWFEAIEQQSQSLGPKSRKPRLRFFNSLRKKVQHTQVAVEHFVKLNAY